MFHESFHSSQLNKAKITINIIKNPAIILSPVDDDGLVQAPLPKLYPEAQRVHVVPLLQAIQFERTKLQFEHY